MTEENSGYIRAFRRLKPYPFYKDSGIEWLGEIPAHWETKKLGWITECLDGRRIPLNADQRGTMQGGYPYWGANTIIDYIDKWLFDEELVLLGEDGAPFFDRTRPVAFHVSGRIWVNNHAHILRPRSIMNPSFLAHALNSLDYHSFIDGSTRDKLTQGEMKGIQIQHPALAEQNSIVAFLDRETAKIDALVEKKVRLIELLQRNRISLITQAVTKGLDPNVPMKDSGVEWLGKIPAHWEVKRLRHIGAAIIGLTYEPADVVDPDDGVLVLRASNVCDGRIVLEDNVFVKRSIPAHLKTKVGDILICARSGSRALIGKSAMIDKTLAGLTFGAFMLVFRSVCNDYLFYAFNSTLFNYQSGAFLTSTINQLTLSNLNNITVPAPPKNERSAIAAFLERETAKTDALVAKIHVAIDRLKEYRTALISASVTGKIDVRNEGFKNPIELKS